MSERHPGERDHIRELEQRLAEAEQTLNALRNGEVDAIVAAGPGGDQVYTLKGADEPYRLMVQQMAEGAVTVRRDGLILFSNEPFASLLGVPQERVIGAHLQEFVALEDFATVSALLAARQSARAEIRLKSNGDPIIVQLSLSALLVDGAECICAVITDLTEQKRNQDLIASEALARSILEQAAEAMVVTGPEGLVLRANTAAASLAGKCGLLHPFDTVFDLHVGSARYTFHKILAAIERGETIKGLEVTVRMAEGHNSDLILSASGLRGAGQRLLGCVISLTDITRRKMIERTLLASESHAKRRLAEIEAIYESAPVGLALLDTNLHYVRVNRRFAEISGFPAEAHIGKRRGTLNPGLCGAAEKAYRRVLSTGEPLLDFEVRGVTAAPPGVERILNENWVPLKDEKGAIAGIAIATEEITEKRRAEEAVRARAAELQVIMDTVPAVTFISRDPECHHLMGNRAAYDFLRTPPDANFSLSAPEGERQTHFRILQNGRELPAEELPVHEAATTGRPVRNQELEVVFDDGQSFWLLGDAVPLVGEDGKPQGAVGAFLDVTERKLTERRLRETQKLENIALLAGGVAHRFNNLLTGILGNADMALQLVPEGGKVAHHLQGVIKSSERAAHLTRQILAYSGKGQFTRQPVDLSSLVRDVTSLLVPTIPSQVSFDLDLPAGLPPVDADLTQMQQLIVDMVVNASEAIGEAAGVITLRTGLRILDWRDIRRALERENLEPGEYVWLEVTDTGCGMDAAIRNRIFDPFFTTKFTGRGLGLAAVAGIVRGHKGAIQVVSEPGKGTSFLVLFPALATTIDNEPTATQPMAKEPLKHGTVLVVDDEEAVRNTARFALEEQGFQVLAADSGPAAIELFAQCSERISVVLLDMSMPGMSGREVLCGLRKVRPGIQVIVSSGYSEADTLQHFAGHQVSGFLEKPYTLRRLLAKVNSALAAGA